MLRDIWKHMSKSLESRTDLSSQLFEGTFKIADTYSTVDHHQPLLSTAVAYYREIENSQRGSQQLERDPKLDQFLPDFEPIELDDVVLNFNDGHDS